jgi:tetratricopeptide (TPR) repeat protein
MKIKTSFILLILVHLFGGVQESFGQDLDSLFAVGEYSKVLENYENSPPTHFESKILRARSLHAKRFYKKALDAYREALFTEEDNPRYQFVYAKLLKDNNQFKPADSLLTQLHERYPSNPEFSYQLGLTKAELGSKSVDIFYLKALQQDPSHQAAAYALATYYFKIRSFKKAEETCETALTFNPSNQKIIGLQGQIYYQQRKLNLALEAFENLEQLTTPPKFVVEKMAIAYANTSQLQKSIVYYKRLLRIEPKNFKYHHQLAKVYSMVKDFESAESHAQISIGLKDTSLDQERFTLALAKIKQDKLKEGIHLLELVIEESPKFERAYVEMALAADRLYTDTDKKLAYYKRYETQFDNYETSTFKNIIYRRLTDLKREKHFKAND